MLRKRKYYGRVECLTGAMTILLGLAVTRPSLNPFTAFEVFAYLSGSTLMVAGVTSVMTVLFGLGKPEAG